MIMYLKRNIYRVITLDQKWIMNWIWVLQAGNLFYYDINQSDHFEIVGEPVMQLGLP